MPVAVSQDRDAATAFPADGHDSLSSRSHELLLRAADPCPLSLRDRLQTEVIVLNRPVAAGIAAHYNQRGVDAEDLRQVAELGLVKAVRRYRPDHGSGFLAYAVPTIRGEIRRYFRDSGWMVRPPRRIQELRGEVIAAENDMVQGLRRFPNVDETADQLGVSIHELMEVQAARGCFRPASLDVPARADGGSAVGELIGSVDSEFERIDNYTSLTPLLAALTPRERLILGLRFVHGHTQQEIGDRIGVSQMQVSRLLNAMLGRLREQLRAD